MSQAYDNQKLRSYNSRDVKYEFSIDGQNFKMKLFRNIVDWREGDISLTFNIHVTYVDVNYLVCISCRLSTISHVF